jgi:ABC-type Fe3+-siderophore transport system permease subunit
MTIRSWRIDWAALGAALLFTLLPSSPFLWGAGYLHWLAAIVFGTFLGLYLYIRRDRHSEPGPDADETRFPR